MKNYLIYLCYGNDDFLSETLFSILSFYKYHATANIQVVVYTDNATFFKKFFSSSIIYNEISDTKIREWKGQINFIHRTKIMVLKDACQKYAGNLLYVDSDTIFLQECNLLFKKIENSAILFDNYEGKLSSARGGIAKKLRNCFKIQNKFFVDKQNDYVEFDTNFEIWNAGIIGFQSKLAPVLDKVLDLVDILYAKFPIFVMEQMAFNFYFQKLQKPLPTEEYIHHYWYFKEFRLVLNHFFKHNKNKTATELIFEIDKIKPELLSVEKRNYKKKNFLQKQIHKLLHFKKWDIAPYNLD